MAGAHDIRNDMQVLGSDGGMVGRVDNVDGDRIKLKRAAETGGGLHHFVPLAWIGRVDDHVHLDRPAAQVREQWTPETGGAAGASAAGHGASDVRTDAYSKRKSNWVIWVAVALLLLVTFYALIRGFSYAA